MCSGKITTRPPGIARDLTWESNTRSVIFFHSPEQEAEAKASRDAAQKNFERPIVTEIVPARNSGRRKIIISSTLKSAGWRTVIFRWL